MPNRRRYHSISLKLTDEELQLWNTKHEASGLSKTDYLMQAIRNSEVRVYSIEESIAPIVHEIRKIGTNLNQLAYFSNIGQEDRVRYEIGVIRRTNDKVMGAANGRKANRTLTASISSVRVIWLTLAVVL